MGAKSHNQNRALTVHKIGGSPGTAGNSRGRKPPVDSNFQNKIQILGTQNLSIYVKYVPRGISENYPNIAVEASMNKVYTPPDNVACPSTIKMSGFKRN
jgi:hypothetical protein